ncbi:TPA: hypothetical protein I7C74_003326 [Vibrio cholerae]|nr:hypothetical protein [Vibrio cholerae]HAS4975632.1 hypothetical protein [Vibrio cholerae]HAS4987129.1 hypothetical protein [Vibrio cholerae]HAS4990976.1 hypothetical protein [Vibrio cholerae]HAS5006391.1 hypothetical protein [Vibrio cholerae]
MSKEAMFTKKKALYGVLVTLSIIMMCFMAYDVVFKPKPVKAAANDFAAAVTQPQVIDAPSYVELEAGTVDSVYEPSYAGLESSKVDLAPVAKAPEKARFQLSVSDKTQKLLDALENDVVSKAVLAANEARLAELTSEKALAEVQAPFPKESAMPPSATSSTVDLISVKSIVFNPTRTTAWLQISNELIPVEQDAFVNDLRVLSIHKNFVRFSDKNGKVFSKYINTKVQRPQQGEQDGLQ